MDTNSYCFSSKLCQGSRTFVCGITTRSNAESSNSRACAPSTNAWLYRQFRLMGKTCRPSELEAAGDVWPVSSPGASVPPAITVLVVFKKFRRSIICLFDLRSLRRAAKSLRRASYQLCQQEPQKAEESRPIQRRSFCSFCLIRALTSFFTSAAERGLSGVNWRVPLD